MVQTCGPLTWSHSDGLVVESFRLEIFAWIHSYYFPTVTSVYIFILDGMLYIMYLFAFIANFILKYVIVKLYIKYK